MFEVLDCDESCGTSLHEYGHQDLPSESLLVLLSDFELTSQNVGIGAIFEV